MAFLRFSLHRVAVSLLGASMALAVWLVFGLRFDLDSSPGWQLLPYFLMLALPLAACSVIWALPAFRWLGRLQFPLSSLVFLLLGAFLIWAWIHSGPYTSIRDDRYFPAVVRASAVSLMGACALGILQAVLMSAILVGRQRGWCWVSRIPWSHRLLPRDPLTYASDLVETGVEQESTDSHEYDRYAEPNDHDSPPPLGNCHEDCRRHHQKGSDKQFPKGDNFLKSHPLTSGGASPRSRDIEGKVDSPG